MTETIVVDPDLARQALGDVLDADAAAQPSAPPPPRREPPPDATPEAPWGFKADGTARKGPPGPGRPRNKDKADQPRVDQPGQASTPDGTPDNSQPAAAVSYAEDIQDALLTVWMGAAAIPWTRGHAAVLHNQIPALVPAWDKAAQSNPAVRKYVVKFSGTGSWAWVIPVTVATLPLVLGMWEVTRNAALRARLAAQTEEQFGEFIMEQARAAGMTFPEDEAPAEQPEAA